MSDTGASRALSDESLVAYIAAEPALLGNERLLILGRSVLIDIGDIGGVLAIDDRGDVHVISSPHGEADIGTCLNVSKSLESRS